MSRAASSFLIFLVLGCLPCLIRGLLNVPAPAVHSRIVAIGDIHGDMSAALTALRLGSLIDSRESWVGGETKLVICGDILDRGDDEWELLCLLSRSWLLYIDRASGRTRA